MRSPSRRLPALLIVTALAMVAGLVASPAFAPPAFAAAGTKGHPTPAPTAIPGPNDNPLLAPLGADEGILVDATTGAVLWSVSATVQRAPASLTKIATAIEVLHRGSLDGVATVTPDAATIGGSMTYAPAGATMTVEDMLWGLLLESGNDMAISLAEDVSPEGTVAGFMNLVNQDVATLGATSTHFVNPHGLDAPGHLSTARDLALLTLYAMKDPLFAQMVGTVHHSVVWQGVEHPMTNHNKLLTLFPGTIGVKTGYTDGSGNALVSENQRGGTTLLAVVIGAKSPAGYGDSEALYNWGFANLATLEARSTERLVAGTLPAVARTTHAAPATSGGAAGASIQAKPAAGEAAGAPDTDHGRTPISSHGSRGDWLLAFGLLTAAGLTWSISSGRLHLKPLTSRWPS